MSHNSKKYTIIFVVICLCLIGFIGYNKTISKKNSIKEQREKELLAEKIKIKKEEETLFETEFKNTDIKIPKREDTVEEPVLIDPDEK